MNATSKNIKTAIDATEGAASNAVSSAARQSRNAVDGAETFGENAKAKVSKTVAAAHDLADETIDDARDALSRSGDRLAETLRRAAEGPSLDSIPGRVMSAVSHGMTSVADTFHDRNLSDIAGDVRALARRNPGVVAVGAAVAGFALARFLRSSMRSHRDQHLADGTHRGARANKSDPSRS